MYENKKIFILGMARSGYEVAKFLTNYNNKILVTDASEQDTNRVFELESLGVDIRITKEQDKLLDETYDVVIKNPGIKYTNPVVEKAKKLNIPVVNELEVAYAFLDKSVKIIGVTGSNGKTTTVTLIYNFLKQELDNVYLCGNIGYPVTSISGITKPNDILVVEISDHQLCDMYDFKTNISVLTNISETHIDFHDSYDRYKMMKKRIFNNHTSEDVAILNYDNDEVMFLTNDLVSKKYYFSKEEKKNSYIKENAIYYNEEKVVDLEDIKIKGMHNYENIMAAIIAVKEFNIKNETIVKVLKEFKGVEHRIEYVDTIKDRKFYNDSKSTNNTATITALKSFTEPVRLIMGGLDRHIPFDDLIPYLTNVKSIECYGETKEEIKALADKCNIPCNMNQTLKEATLNSYKNSNEGDIILLSPACASWDQYKCFEDRGEEFKKVVEGLNEN